MKPTKEAASTVAEVDMGISLVSLSALGLSHKLYRYPSSHVFKSSEEIQMIAGKKESRARLVQIHINESFANLYT